MLEQPRHVDRTMTDRNLDVYRWIYEFTRMNGFQPSFREIGEHFGVRSPNGVSYHIEKLEQLGYIEINHAASRSLIFLLRPDGSEFSGFLD